MHATDAQLDLLLRAELSAHEAAAVREHTASCPACVRRRDELERSERALADALRMLDEPLPAVTADAIFARSARLGRRRSWRIAATLGALAVAGAAAAMPGSPLRTLAERTPPVTRPSPAPPANIVVRPAAPMAVSGLTMPARERVIVDLVASQRSGTIRIRRASGADLRMRAIGGQVDFAARSDGARISNEGSTSSYELEIPARSTQAEVRVAGTVVFATSGASVTVGPAPSADGSYLVRLASP